MAKEYNINDIVLLNTQRMISLKLQKGDIIYVGKEVQLQAEEILKNNKVAYVIVEHAFNVMMIVIN